VSDTRLQALGKLALVFPGQGTQHVGMGQELYASYPEARRLFDQADDSLGFSLSRLCFEGPETDLGDTSNAQPAILTVSAALLALLQSRLGDELTPCFVAGHSLGEFTAYYAAGALGFTESIRLVRLRGELMKQAGEQNPGAMAAILGLDPETLRSVCTESGEVWLANDNCPGQVVISGDKPTLELALPRIEEAGAKRVVPLAVSVASHSPLMESITADFARALAAMPFNAPRLPVIGNVHAAPLESAEAIRAELGAQLTSTVRWTESVQAMRARGIETFVELGPKDVLSGLVKRIDRTAQRHTLNSADTVQSFLSQCGASEAV